MVPPKQKDIQFSENFKMKPKHMSKQNENNEEQFGTNDFNSENGETKSGLISQMSQEKHDIMPDNDEEGEENDELFRIAANQDTKGQNEDGISNVVHDESDEIDLLTTPGYKV